MPDQIQLAAGSWWRFSDYQIENGKIRPVPGAELVTFDPWEEYYTSLGSQVLRAPYQNLMADIGGLKFKSKPGPGPLRRLEPKSAKALLGLCHRYGLLGLISHRTMMAWTAPRWVPMKNDPCLLIPVQRQYVRTSEGWTTYIQPKFSVRHSHLRNQPQRCGDLVKDSEGADDWHAPEALIQREESDPCHSGTLTETWRRYFPDVPRTQAVTHCYPEPFSVDFWRAYAEPVEDYVRCVNHLRRALWHLKGGNDASKTGDSPASPRAGMDILHAMTRTVRPTLMPAEDGAYRQEWLSTSMIGTFAMMALLDISQNKRMLICGSCGVIFSTNAYQALYCSSTCRDTAQKRRHRERKRIGNKSGN